MTSITGLEENIKNLKIQGATAVAFAVLDGLKIAEKELDRQPNLDPHIFLQEQSIRLAFSRPTEPLAQNAVRFIFQKKQNSLPAYFSLASQYKKMISESKNKIAELGSNFISNGGTYLTHCHSSTVTDTFISAYTQNKKFRIYVTETRPLLQGRITVKELLTSGVRDIYMIIDSLAPGLLLENKIKIGAVFVGADLLTQNGFVNKVGSLGIARIAAENQIPLYCLCTLLKYDPRPFSQELIEKRDSREIWENAPPELNFLTPAFDIIPYEKNITFVTEAGLLKGGQIESEAYKLYPFLGNKNREINEALGVFEKNK